MLVPPAAVPMEEAAHGRPDPSGGIDLVALVPWLNRHGCVVESPLTATQIEGGRSNLTYFITDATGMRWVLRRPPLGLVLSTAHDVVREVKILRALAGVVPVPEVIGLGEDAAGVPYYVMREVPGQVIRTAADADALSPKAREACGRELMSGLAALHSIPPESVGLGAFGRGTGYLQRQILLWQRMGDQYRTQEFPAADSVRDQLLARVPEQDSVVLVHGDYRLDNVLFDDAGQLNAILDWELCTQGDPYVDLAVCSYYWTDPDDRIHPFADPPMILDGFLRRDQLIEAYVRAGGRPLPHPDYYFAYAAWRLALVFEGVLGRFTSGAYGGSDPNEERRLAETIQLLVEHAQNLLDRQRTE